MLFILSTIATVRSSLDTLLRGSLDTYCGVLPQIPTMLMVFKGRA